MVLPRILFCFPETLIRTEDEAGANLFKKKTKVIHKSLQGEKREVGVLALKTHSLCTPSDESLENGCIQHIGFPPHSERRVS